MNKVNDMGKKSHKNIEMLKCFFKVMRNDRAETEKILPCMYAKSFNDIDFEFLKNLGIDKFIVDVDNTIVPVESIDVGPELQGKFKLLKEMGFKFCLVSNNDDARVRPVAEKLDLLDYYLAKANKPMAIAYEKALAIVGGDHTDTAMIGDQMLTDIKGANEYGVYSILVDPVDDKYEIKTGTSRVLQNMIERNLERNGIDQLKTYYKKGR